MLAAVAVLALLGSSMAFPEDCPNVTVLHSVKGDGWYDACLGLDYQKDAATAEDCKAGCHANTNCSVWQFIKHSDGTEKCWSGNVVYGCLSRMNAATLETFEGDLQDGERIQHGFIKIVSETGNAETMGLKNYPEKTGTDAEKSKRCQQFCETDVTCTVWQYAPSNLSGGGCWLEHLPSNPKKEQRTESAFAKAMTAGQTLEHTCPPYVPPKDGLPWGWIIAGIVLGLLALAAILYAVCKREPKVKPTRTIKKPEPKPEPEPVYYVTQSVLVPQPSVLVYQQQPLIQPTASVIIR